MDWTAQQQLEERRRQEECLQFHLPMPPSANSIWRSTAGRVYRSAQYVAWHKRALALMLGLIPMAPRYKVLYEFGRPSRRKMDLGNREKALSDALQAAGVITDDSLIVDLQLRWAEDVPGGEVRVSIWTV